MENQARPLDVDLLEHDLEYPMGLRSIAMFNDGFGLSVGQDGIKVAERFLMIVIVEPLGL